MTKKKLIIGLGKTGQALLDYFSERKIPCVGFDEEPAEKFESLKEKYLAVDLYFSEFPKIFEMIEQVFVSPGVPPTRKWVQEAIEKGIPVTGELEFAFCQIHGSVIAVTGTNGKSTTVSLLHAMLKAGGKKSSLKGNIGQPLVAAVSEPPQDFYVVEVSSYQLETVETFHPKVAVMMNVTADHLERYKDMDDYATTKERITHNQNAADYFVFNADDTYCMRMARRSKAHLLPFSLVNVQKEGGYVDRNEMVVRVNGNESRYQLADCSLVGLHNQENMLATILSAKAVGLSDDVIGHTLRNFQALPHRLAKVGTFRGITFYDDSKGTNVGSVVMSLASFDENVILILGGRDKGGDYAPLKSLIKGKVKALIVMGEAREIIEKSLGGIKPTYVVETMKEAVKQAYTVAASGDVVLLSPACSSFDQYKNYAERGDDFCKWAKILM